MDTLSYKTIAAKESNVNKNWLLIDAENATLGRLSAKIASILRGKTKTNFSPHFDCGDHVIVINAEKVRLTGNKLRDKVYKRYTGFPGGQRFATATELVKKHPTALVEKAVKGMLPKTKLGDKQYGNLFVYAGTAHPHQAQQPKQISL